MKLSHRHCVGLAEDMLHGAGLTTTFRHGRHLRLTATNKVGQSAHMTLSSSPGSDLNCQMNMARQAAGRLIRQLAPMAKAPVAVEHHA